MEDLKDEDRKDIVEKEERTTRSKQERAKLMNALSGQTNGLEKTIVGDEETQRRARWSNLERCRGVNHLYSISVL